jgi:hypothetical protein
MCAVCVGGKRVGSFVLNLQAPPPLPPPLPSTQLPYLLASLASAMSWHAFTLWFYSNGSAHVSQGGVLRVKRGSSAVSLSQTGGSAARASISGDGACRCSIVFVFPRANKLVPVWVPVCASLHPVCDVGVYVRGSV